MTDLRQTADDLNAAKDAVVEATKRVLNLQKATLEVRKPALEAARAALANLPRSPGVRLGEIPTGWTAGELVYIAEWLLDQHDEDEICEVTELGDAEPRYASAVDHAITDG